MNILVTGGASFIGSHLVESLVKKYDTRDHKILVVDNLSTGRKENLKNVMNKVIFIKKDLTNYKDTLSVTKSINLIYHLAAVHGGREYIHYHEPDTADNLAINHNLIKSAWKNNVQKIIFTSSACIYPERLQSKDFKPLKENDIDLSKELQADKLYGWGKLMCEMELKVFYEAYGLKSAIARFFTAYGPRENTTHAIIALLTRAINKENPFLVWGDGTQGRDFIYVSDLISGLLKLDNIDNASPINFGYGKLITIDETVEKIFELTNFYPTVKYDTQKPVGPYRRVADISKAKELLNWAPKVSLEEGLKKTYEYLLSNSKAHRN